MAFKIASSVYDNQGGSNTVINNSSETNGNQSGKKGTVSSALNSGNLVVTLDQTAGNYFDFTPDYSGVSGDVRFDFGNPPVKNFEFYLFWHNYQDTYNNSTNTFNNYQTVNFKDAVGTLNNSNTGLISGFTQIFKFTTIDTGTIYYGNVHMRNCR